MVSVPFADAAQQNTRVHLSLRWRHVVVVDYVTIGGFGTVVFDRPDMLPVRYYIPAGLPVAFLWAVLPADGEMCELWCGVYALEADLEEGPLSIMQRGGACF